MRRMKYAAIAAGAAAVIVPAAMLTPGTARGQGTAAFTSYDCASQGSAGLQGAEDSLAAGGTLLVSGTCTTDITVQPETTLEGDPGGTDIVGSVFYGGSGDYPVTIRNLRIDCGTAVACLNISDGWRVNVSGIVTYGGTYGVEVSAPACSKGAGCNPNDYFTHLFLSASSSYAFYVNDPANTITDGYLTDSDISAKADAIHLQNAAGWQVLNNHVYGGTTGIYAWRLYASEISGNDLEEGSITGIAQKSSQPSVISGNKVARGTITQTAIGPGCYLTIYGNITSTPVSTTGCTVAEAANITITAARK